MFIAGIVCVIIGWSWNAWFPINKSLWTSSYVFFTGGLALQFLALCYWLIDIKGYKLWTKPFVIFGVNAIVLFVGTGVMARLMGLIKVPKDGRHDASAADLHLQSRVRVVAAAEAEHRWRSRSHFILLWLFLMWLLYRKKIIVKI